METLPTQIPSQYTLIDLESAVNLAQQDNITAQKLVEYGSLLISTGLIYEHLYSSNYPTSEFFIAVGMCLVTIGTLLHNYNKYQLEQLVKEKTIYEIAAIE